MDRADVVKCLRAHEARLRKAGVGGLYLFGSVAEGRAHDGSDVDLFFDLERAEGFTLFDLAGLRDDLEALVGAPVDLMSRNAIHPRKKDRILKSGYKIF